MSRGAGCYALVNRSPVAHTNRLGDFAYYRFNPLQRDLPQTHAGWGHR